MLAVNIRDIMNDSVSQLLILGMEPLKANNCSSGSALSGKPRGLAGWAGMLGGGRPTPGLSTFECCLTFPTPSLRCPGPAPWLLRSFYHVLTQVTLAPL